MAARVSAWPVRGGTLLRCEVCGAELVATCDDCQRNFVAQHQHTHYGLGDVVAKGIKVMFGIKPCPACEQRKARLNAMAPRVWRRR